MSFASRIWFIVSGLFIIFVVMALPQLSHAADCPAGTSPATSADLDAMKLAGIPDPKVGTCWDSSSKTTGAETGQAKEYLRSTLCGSTGNNYGGMGPDGTVSGLDAKFAVCAAKFFKAATQAGIPVCLREGKRSVAKQEQYAEEYRRGGGIACTKGAACEHPRGIAIDVNTNSEDNYRKLHAMARQYGVIFYLGFKDKVHFVPNGGDCSAGGTSPHDFSSGRQSPFLGDSLLRKLLSTPPPPPTTSPAATQPTLSSAPPIGVVNSTAMPLGVCAPQFYCIGNINYYRTSTCIDQVYQTCAGGCSGTMCVGSTTPSMDSNSNSNTNTNGTSTYDQIGQYADNGTTAIATVTPIALNPNTSNPNVLQPSQTQGENYQGTVVVPQPTSPQGTFISNDLANSAPGQSQSTYFATLNSIKNTLIGLLNYLRPFGGNIPSQQMYAD